MIKILDIGCGRGTNIPEYQQNNFITGIDLNPNFIKISKKRFPKHNFFVMDAHKLDFPNNSFDLIYCIDLIEHVNNPKMVLDEANRVLKNNGKLIIEIPYYKSEKLFTRLNPKYQQEIGHKTIFTTKTLSSLFNKTKFQNIKLSPKKFIDNIYYTYFFLNDLHIINQQGDLNINTKRDKQIADTLIKVNSSNSVNYNNLTKALLHLINCYGSLYFPKTINIQLVKSNFPKNKINFNFSLKTKDMQSIYSQIRLIYSILPTDNKNPLKIIVNKLEKENKLKDNIILKNKIILDSKYQLLYPLYSNIKKIFFK